jgi:hypothetical protein
MQLTVSAWISELIISGCINSGGKQPLEQIHCFSRGQDSALQIIFDIFQE